MTHLIDPQELQDFIGKELGGDDWLNITQERINQFAETTEDRQFIHIDPERAKQTTLGGTIAHGMLTLSLMPYFYEKSGIQLKWRSITASIKSVSCHQCPSTVKLG